MLRLSIKKNPSKFEVFGLQFRRSFISELAVEVIRIEDARRYLKETSKLYLFIDINFYETCPLAYKFIDGYGNMSSNGIHNAYSNECLSWELIPFPLSILSFVRRKELPLIPLSHQQRALRQ